MITKEATNIQSYRPLRAAFAGFAGGYIMALAGYWIQAVFGISELDFAHTSLRYVAGGKPGWWVVGIISHLIDSVLLGLLYARLFHRPLMSLARPFGRFWDSIVAGIAFGAGIWVVLAMLIAMPFMGAGVFGRKTRSARPALGDLILHVLFGLLLSLIYEDDRGYRWHP